MIKLRFIKLSSKLLYWLGRLASQASALFFFFFLNYLVMIEGTQLKHCQVQNDKHNYSEKLYCTSDSVEHRMQTTY